jgi:hypothetical protein
MQKKLICIFIMIGILFNYFSGFVAAATKYEAAPGSGWYYLRIMGNYLNVDEKGNLELREKKDTDEGNTKFRVYNYGNGDYELELEDGRFVGIEISEEKMVKSPSKVSGLRLKAVKKDDTNYMTRWNIYSENNFDIFHIRPRMNIDYVVNASGKKKVDGTAIIVSKHVDRGRCVAYPTPNAPNHAEIRFIPVLPAVFKVKSNNTPYRDKPEGKKLGELKSGDKLWVTEINGNWATVNDKGNIYYIGSTKIETVNPTIDAGFVVKSYPSKGTYKVGEKFDVKGLSVIDITGGKGTSLVNELTYHLIEMKETKNGYFTMEPVKIKVGYKFNKVMIADIEIRYKEKKLLSHTIEVIK